MTKPGPKTGVPCHGLADAIARAGLTATEAASRAKLGRTQVANWLSRGRAPKPGLERLAKVLGTSLEELAEAPEADPLRDALDRIRAAEQHLRDVEDAAREAAGALREARAALGKVKTGS
jgi:transcriptional regulator with XRE-family HTH domain